MPWNVMAAAMGAGSANRHVTDPGRPFSRFR